MHQRLFPSDFFARATNSAKVDTETSELTTNTCSEVTPSVIGFRSFCRSYCRFFERNVLMTSGLKPVRMV